MTATTTAPTPPPAPGVVSWRLLGDGAIPTHLHCTIEGHTAFRSDGVRAAITDCLWVIIGPCECVTDTEPTLAWPALPLLSEAQAIERAAGSATAAADLTRDGARAVLMRVSDFHREIRDRLASPSVTALASGLRCQRAAAGSPVTHHVGGRAFRLVAAETWETGTRYGSSWRVHRKGGTWYLTDRSSSGRRSRVQLLGVGSTALGLGIAAERIHQLTRRTVRASA